MMRLIRVELHRLLSRKVLLLAVLGVVAIVLVTLYGVHDQARTINEARSGADEMLAQQQADWDANGERYLQECLDGEAAEREAGNAEADWGCEQMKRPTAEDFYGVMPSLAEQYRQLLTALVYPFMFLALAIGSTMVAAEFSHRTMGTWLTFEPRRTPVFLSKVLAPAIGAIPLAVTGLLLILIGIPIVFRLNDIDDGLTGGDWTSVSWMSLRLLALVALSGAFGAVLAFILKHSAAVIGLMVGYLVLVEGVIGSMFPKVSTLLLGNNIRGFIQHGTEWTTYGACDENGCRETIHRLTFTESSAELAVLLLLAGLLAWALFRTSDVD